MAMSMAMTVEQTQKTMQEYADALLAHRDFAQHFSDDVVCTLEGTDQRYQGRDAVSQWISSSHALGEIRMVSMFAGQGHAAVAADFIRTDGTHVPYAVLYDLANGKITALRLYFTGPVQ